MFKSFTTMILAAGFGRRMKPLTNKIPKPLIEVKNISLLKNSIDFFLKCGSNKIVINTHYKHDLILKFINKYYQFSNIFLSYEKEILDTAGGVKNAISQFDCKNVLVANSDIYWKKENEKDVLNLINSFTSKDQCRLLLVRKENAYGIIKKGGDFSLSNNLVTRWKTGDNILYYSGLQILSTNILNNFMSNKFSFNEVWDLQINKNSLTGNIMFSDCYHVGDKKGLIEAENSKA